MKNDVYNTLSKVFLLDEIKKRIGNNDNPLLQQKKSSNKYFAWLKAHRLYAAMCGIVGFICVVALLLKLTIGRAPKSISWNNGTYTGETFGGIPNGNGQFVKDGATYTGYWQHGEMTAGKIVTAKLVFDGSLKGNKFNGYGVAIYKNGKAYCGYWANDYKEGLGLQRDSTGRLAFGFFKEGILQRPEDTYFQVGDRVYGIDVSRHQGNIAWPDLYLACNEKGGVNGIMPDKPTHMQPVLFAIVKSTQGTGRRDALYERNSREARRCGKIYGAYHFLTMGASGKAQAQFYIANTNLSKGNFPPLLDLEKNTAEKKSVSDKEFAAIIPIAKEWIATVKAHYGVNPIIYTNMHIYKKFVATDPELRKYDLWLAAPGTKKPTAKRCIIWQFSHSGTANGIKENDVDLNLYNGTYADLERYIKDKGIK